MLLSHPRLRVTYCAQKLFLAEKKAAWRGTQVTRIWAAS